MVVEPARERPSVATVEVGAWQSRSSSIRSDHLAVEEPLEIRLAGCSVAVTMRTPGHDLELAAGFLLTEGIIESENDIASLAHCPADDPEAEGNVVNANPRNPGLVDPDRWRRNFFAASSCGICGKGSIRAVRQDARPLCSTLRVGVDTLYRLDAALQREQAVFSQTGGLHAAGLFDAAGCLLVLREDVGRHNAVDKVIGWALARERLPLSDAILLVSGRASFEIVQKALMAGIPLVAAVSAPSSLAVDLARSAGMTLIGFLRTERFNVYAGEERIAPTV